MKCKIGCHFFIRNKLYYRTTVCNKLGYVCMYYSMYVSINANSSYVIIAFANI